MPLSFLANCIQFANELFIKESRYLMFFKMEFNNKANFENKKKRKKL